MQGVLRMLPACCAAIAGIRHAPSLRTGGSRAALISMRGGSSATGDLRLSLLREELVAARLHALVVPSGDAHLGEYVHPCYERRAFISGFTGSAGTVLVTREEALLWTDGRYFLQAEKELSDEWTLMRMNQEAVPTLEDWLSANLPEGGLLGIDPSGDRPVRALDRRRREAAGGGAQGGGRGAAVAAEQPGRQRVGALQGGRRGGRGRRPPAAAERRGARAAPRRGRAERCGEAGGGAQRGGSGGGAGVPGGGARRGLTSNTCSRRF